jgi:hypothetical protein
MVVEDLLTLCGVEALSMALRSKASSVLGWTPVLSSIWAFVKPTSFKVRAWALVAVSYGGIWGDQYVGIEGYHHFEVSLFKWEWLR